MGDEWRKRKEGWCSGFARIEIKHEEKLQVELLLSSSSFSWGEGDVGKKRNWREEKVCSSCGENQLAVCVCVREGGGEERWRREAEMRARREEGGLKRSGSFFLLLPILHCGVVISYSNSPDDGCRFLFLLPSPCLPVLTQAEENGSVKWRG